MLVKLVERVKYAYLSIMLSVRTLLSLNSKYGVIVEQFLLSFHLVHFKHKSKFHQKIYEKVEWLSLRVVVITMSLALFCAGVFNTIPIINNISSGAYKDPNKTIELSIFYSYPGFDPQNHYNFATVCNFYLGFACSSLIVGIDLIITLFVIHIIGHIAILNNTLTTFPKPENPAHIMFKTGFGRTTQSTILTTTLYSMQENLLLKDKIKQCVEHHLFIVRFTDDVSAFFGPVIAVYYIFHQVSGCVLLLELSPGDAAALTKYGPLTVAVFGQLIVISVIFEIVNTKSEQLADAVYGMPWESMSVSNQRSVCQLLQRLQTPIAIKALGVIAVNVNTMSKILKTSFSYFTFLKTLND